MKVRTNAGRWLFATIMIALGAVIFYLTLDNGDTAVSVILRILTGVVMTYCLVMGSKETSMLNPYWLFALVPFSLLMYSAKVSKVYLSTLETETWILATFNMIAFLVGYRLLFFKSSGWEQYPVDDVPVKQYKKNAYIMLFIGKLPWFVGKVFHTTMPLAAPIALFAYAAIVFAIKTKSKRTIFIIIAIQVATMMTGSINKTATLFFVMTCLLSYERFYIKDNAQRTRLAVTSVIMLILFLAIIFPLKDYLVSGGDISNFANSDMDASYNYYAPRIDWTGNKRLMMPYMYLVTPWNNLQYVMQTQDVRTNGLWLVKPILGYFGLDETFRESYKLIPANSFNTYTYIAVCFKDFGFWGSMLDSFALGLFVKYIYQRKYCKSVAAYDTACYVYTACATAEMFFSNHFFAQSYPFTIVLIMFIYKNMVKFINSKRQI